MEELNREQMLQALQARREAAARPEPVFTRRTVFFSLMALVLFAALAWLIVRRPAPAARPADSARAEHLKRVADRLKLQGLPEQAVRYYARYLDAADLPPRERANVCYLAAEQAAKAGRYEDALAWLADARVWGPDAALQTDLGRLERRCFERLGRPLDADYQLAASTSLTPQKNDPRAKVVAVVGSEKITMRDIDDAIQALPEFLRKRYADPQHKPEFVQQYVGTRILYEKAKRLGYDKDPDVRRRAEANLMNLVVAQFVQKEIADKIRADESDLKLYYQVHRAEFTEPAEARVAHILVASRKAAADLIAKLKAGADFADLARKYSKDADTRSRGGEISEWLRERGRLAAIPDAPDLSRLVFACKPGDVAPEPVKSARGFHVVKVLERKAARVKPFSEVRSLVRRAYLAQKQQERLDQVLRQAREQLHVQVFLDALAAPAGKAKGAKAP